MVEAFPRGELPVRFCVVETLPGESSHYKSYHGEAIPMGQLELSPWGELELSPWGQLELSPWRQLELPRKMIVEL